MELLIKRICGNVQYAWASKEIFHDLPVVHTVKDIYLDRRVITDEEYVFCKAALEKPKEEVRFVNTGDRKKIPQVLMELHVIKVGNIAFASNR